MTDIDWMIRAAVDAAPPLSTGTVDQLRIVFATKLAPAQKRRSHKRVPAPRRAAA